MKPVKWILGLIIIAFCAPTVSAQETVSEYDPNSVKRIPKYEQFYKKRVWRRMDLEEKQNAAFFAFNNEITKIIVEAVKAGTLKPYVNDSLKTEMSLEDFNEKMKLPGMDEGGDDPFGDGAGGDDAGGGWGDTGGGWGDTGGGWGDTEGGEGEEEEEVAISTEFLPNQITLLQIMEDQIFDKRRSTLYYDILGITLFIPAENFETGINREVATFKYQDLVKLFRSMPEEAIWFNRQNSAEHRNLADAFELRLFNARLIKVDNPRDQYIADIYGRYPKEHIMASQWLEIELMEREHNLWEY